MNTTSLQRMALACCLAGGVACQGERPARAPEQGELLISQLYTTGAVPAGGTERYFSDQFIEVVNASADPLDLSGVHVADAFGAAGEINDGMVPNQYRSAYPNDVVLSTVWRIPDGTRLEPGAFLQIAQDGTNHRPFSTIDLSSAGFEAYVADSDRDADSPTVPNLEEVAYNAGIDWLMTVFGPSVVLIDANVAFGEASGPGTTLLTAPEGSVLDGVECLMDGDAGAFKRLPDAVDAGFTFAEGPYTGTAVHRRNVDGVWQDTNDASADFYVDVPSPALPEASDQVFGDPALELGTGIDSFQALSDGDTMELVAGLQGGWHLDVAVAFDGFGPAGVTLVYDAVDDTAERRSFVTEAVLFEENVVPADAGWTRVGDRVVLDITDPVDVAGTELIVRVTAALDGESWSDERRITVVDEVP